VLAALAPRHAEQRAQVLQPIHFFTLVVPDDDGASGFRV
jgi:hypothetical protein